MPNRSPAELLQAVLGRPEMYMLSPLTERLEEEIRRVLKAEREKTKREMEEIIKVAA